MEFQAVSGPKFTGLFSLNAGGIVTFSDFAYIEPFRRYSPSTSEVVQNWPKFCMFLAPNIFGGSAPEFLEWDYKIQPDFDDVAKFQGDRSRELGERVAKKKSRGAWQCQTWGRPASQVRVQNQFQEDEIPLAVMAGRMKKFSENTSTIPEVMDSSCLARWILRQILSFHDCFFGGETPVPLRVCASKPLSISSVCKNFRAQHPLRAEIESPEKSPLGCTYIKVNNFYVCGPKYA